ncbi:J domain-containing protein [Pseudarthrobacter sulfonivorans]|uniref:J domain-containing protein n=1 Tax=Pseudarthrobacter sulfonivorans TaxID=121292 RepID=UPI0021055852|nr:J domain-containing protein [Pseudarthrobacter sulfonivorans]
MTSQPDYYKVLRVEPAASQQEISRAYRALMRTHHPDVEGAGTVSPVAGGEPNGSELLQIMHAYSVLRDPARRAEYDRSRAGHSAREAAPGTAPTVIPVRKVADRGARANNTIRISPVHWESGPWA